MVDELRVEGVVEEIQVEGVVDFQVEGVVVGSLVRVEGVVGGPLVEGVVVGLQVLVEGVVGGSRVVVEDEVAKTDHRRA